MKTLKFYVYIPNVVGKIRREKSLFTKLGVTGNCRGVPPNIWSGAKLVDTYAQQNWRHMAKRTYLLPSMSWLTHLQLILWNVDHLLIQSGQVHTAHATCLPTLSKLVLPQIFLPSSTPIKMVSKFFRSLAPTLKTDHPPCFCCVSLAFLGGGWKFQVNHASAANHHKLLC